MAAALGYFCAQSPSGGDGFHHGRREFFDVIFALLQEIREPFLLCIHCRLHGGLRVLGIELGLGLLGALVGGQLEGQILDQDPKPRSSFFLFNLGPTC